jgi:YVTN family beta-propeller protein
VAITHDGRFGYVTNQNSNTISVLDTSDNALVHTIPVEAIPNGLAFSADRDALYVANLGLNSADVSVIDTDGIRTLFRQ